MKSIKYKYVVENIGDDKEDAYYAYIPAFHGHVFGDTLEELMEAIIFSIESEIKERKADGRPIPPPDKSSSYTGKFMLRIKPTLHETLSLEALAEHMSLNKYIENKLSA